MPHRCWLGVDTGGTFTDFVLWQHAALRIHKVPSTPKQPEQAILQGIADLGLMGLPCMMIHGSTVATNAVLEGKGCRVAYVADQGLADVLNIGRQARRSLYQLQPDFIPPLIADADLHEVNARIDATGQPQTPLSEQALQQLLADLQGRPGDAVAINLLFSYLNPAHEQRIAKVLQTLGRFISVSHQVLPRHKEYERGMATWLNAYVGPLMQRYLHQLQQALPEQRIAVMQSSGDTLQADHAAQQSVRLLLSGPAGGLNAARHIARTLDIPNLLTLDMGGTSTDVALVQGEIQITDQGQIGPYPVAVPQIDLHTIGAGGGSLAHLDQAGMLHVGPASAGADPGPACYGRGGRQATVSDANAVLGRLPAKLGRCALDKAAARAVIQELADAMQLSLEDAAQGILDLANQNMAQALRLMSSKRGINPENLTLMAFGGAGGLHVCDLADQLAIKHLLLPAHAGALSALGMLLAAPGRTLNQGVYRCLQQCREADIQALLEQMHAQAAQALRDEGHPQTDEAQVCLLMRYQGQEAVLELALQPWSNLAERFEQAHAQRYGHRLAQAIELAEVRLRLTAHVPDMSLPPPTCHPSAMPAEYVSLWLDKAWHDVPCLQRQHIVPDQLLHGPLLIVDSHTTVLIHAGWHGHSEEQGHLLWQRDALHGI